MPKFLAVHTLPGPMTPEDVTPLVQKLLGGETKDAYWVKAFGQLNQEGKAVRYFCEWNAKDSESIREVFAKTPEFPLDGIYPMAIVDSEDIRSL